VRKCYFCDQDSIKRIKIDREVYDICEECIKKINKQPLIEEVKMTERRKAERRKK
jgi:hypothetical protein